MSILQAVNVTKVYAGGHGTVAVRAVEAINLTVEPGEFVGIMGPSGSGKTTLLQLLGSIDMPTSGEVIIDGERLSDLSPNGLALFRRRRLGFIFQDFNLLDSLTIRENIIMPLVLERRPAAEIAAAVAALTDRMGIGHLLDQYPYTVSGGERQRTAAARALIHAPALVLADEPTGNLDSKSARMLMESLAGRNEQAQATILMVTHDPISASYCRRILFIKDGRTFAEIRRGDDPRHFYHQILDALSTMGGEQVDLTYARP